jgi:hypothetical protein
VPSIREEGRAGCPLVAKTVPTPARHVLGHLCDERTVDGHHMYDTIGGHSSGVRRVLLLWLPVGVRVSAPPPTGNGDPLDGNDGPTSDRTGEGSRERKE